MDEFGQPGDLVSQLYSIETSNKATEYDLGIGGIGDLEEFTGTIPYGDFVLINDIVDQYGRKLKEIQNG